MLPADPKIAYVVKVYPRFSETFVVTEILAREAAGEKLAIYALRPTSDSRFHPQLAQVQAPVTHLPRASRLSAEWDVFRRAEAEIPGFAERFGALMPMLVRMGPSDVSQAVDLALRLKVDGITHVHVHFANVASWCTAVASALTGIEFTVTTHAKDLFHDDVDRVLLRQVLELATNVVAISEYNAGFLRDEVGLPESKIQLVRNGLDLDRFTYRDPATPTGPLKVLAVGRLVEKKGFGYLLDAVASLAGELPVEVRIVGEGELGGVITRQVEALGLTDTVKLLGARSQAELISELDWADVLAAPCVVGSDGNADGLPTVILEAMASGVPCIATDVTGIPEAIGNEAPVTGILLSANPADLADRVAASLRTVADESWPRVDVARAARARVEEAFDTRRQAGLLTALESTGTPMEVAR